MTPAAAIMEKNVAGQFPEGYGNCGLVALATVTGIPYAEVHDWFRRTHRKPPSWKGGTTHWQQRQFLEHLGMSPSERGCHRPHFTLERWVREIAAPRTTYIVGTGRHAQVVRDGLVLDQNTRGIFVPVSRFWGRKKRVWRYLVVECAPAATNPPAQLQLSL